MTLTNLLVLIAAIICTCLAQIKFKHKATQRSFSFLGGLACLVVAAEAFLRDDNASTFLFGCAAATNLLIAAFNYPQPANDER